MIPREAESLPRIVPQSIMAELKQRDAPYHQALDINANIWGSITSRVAYRHSRCTFCGFIATLEGRLDLIDDLQLWLPDVSQRWKLVGICSGQCTICTFIPNICFLGDAFGCLYVLEGSTLSGQVIAPQVYNHLGLTPENGCRLFSSYGAAAGSMWKNFGESRWLTCTEHPGIDADA